MGGLRITRAIKALTAVALTIAAVALATATPAWAADGDPSFVETIANGEGGIDGLASSVETTTSPDGAHVYATSAADGTLAAFSRVAGTGQLTFVEAEREGVGGLEGLGFANSPLVSPDGKFVYAASISDNAVSVFSRTAGTGELSHVQTLDESTVASISGPISLEMSPDGAFIYVATQGSGSSSTESIVVLSRDETTGELAFVESQTANGADTRDLAIDPDGEYLYSVRSSGNDVAVFSIDPSTGELTFESSLDLGVDARALVTSSDGKHVYVVSRANQGAVHALSADPSDGSLSLIESEVSGQNGVSGLVLSTKITISPDGKYVIASSYNNSAAVFSRDDSTGELTFVSENAGLAGGGNLSVTPDSAHLLVGSFSGDTLDVLSLATGTGALSAVQQLSDSQGGLSGLNAPRTIAAAPDGEHLYAISEVDDALVALDRDTATGELSYVETEFDGVDGASLSSARDIVVSPSGDHVYVAAADDARVATFERDASTGELTAFNGGGAA